MFQLMFKNVKVFTVWIKLENIMFSWEDVMLREGVGNDSQLRPPSILAQYLYNY